MAKRFYLMIPLLIPLISAFPTQDVPFRTQRLSDHVLFIKTGDSHVMSNVTALSTSKGIVVVDSHYKPDWGRKIRGIIEEAFHRKDFVYLIYTHAGVDHMGGRPAFPDAELIGHDNCITQIDNLHRTIETIDVREGLAPRLKLIKEQIDQGPAESTKRVRLKEARIYWSELADLLASGFRYARPSITFQDSLSLHMGNLTLKLKYCTPGYSSSDICIHVPQEKLLIVGDIFVKHRIPLINENTDIIRWRTVFKPFIEREIDIKHIIGCHGDLMSIADLKTQLDYLSDLWKAVLHAKQEGLTLAQAKGRLSFNSRYPHLHHLITRWVGTPFDLHERNIEQAWKGLGDSI